MKKLIILGLLAVVLIAGCIQMNSAEINSTACKSEWKYNPEGNPSFTFDGNCTDSCYNKFQTNTSKLEESKTYNCHCKDLQASLVMYPEEGENVTQLCNNWCQTQGKLFDSVYEYAPNYKCYCDINNCNP